MGLIINPYISFGGGGTDADAEAFITAASITDSTQQTAIRTLVTGLKSASLWSKMAAIYPFIGGSAASHAVNLRSPGTYDLTFSGGITHDASGAAWNGSTGYASTGLVPSTVLSANDEHYSYYSVSSSTTNAADIGSAYSTGQAQWSGIELWGGIAYCLLNNGNNATATPSASMGGSGAALWTGSRTASNAAAMYKNGSSIATSTDNNIWSRSNRAITIGATDYAGTVSWFSDRQCAWASIGSGLTSTDVGNLYTLVQAYQTTLGRQV